MAASRNTVLPVILVVAVLAVAGGAWFLLSEPSGIDDVARVEDDADTGPGEVYDAAVREVVPDREVERIAAPRVDDDGHASERPTAAARLAGRAVRASDGSPLVGLAMSGSFQPQNLDEAASRLVTGEDGGFEFALPVDGKAWWIEIEAGPRTPRHRHREEIALHRGETVEVELRVPDGGLLSGSVEDGAGRPLAEVTVAGWSGSRWSLSEEPDRTFVTDGSGHWELPALGPSFVLSAEADGLVPSYRLHGTVDDDEHKQGLVLLLERAVPVRGRVVDAFERPVEDARIRAESRMPETPTDVDGVYRMALTEREGKSDAQGRFLLEDGSAREWRVHVDQQGYAHWEAWHDPTGGDLLVRLSRGATVTGTVLSSAGVPLPEAEVILDSAGLESANSSRTRTDETGHYAIDNLRPDDVAILSVVAPGHAVEVKQPVSLSADGAARIDFVLAAERVISGVVVDTAGRPVVEANVAIEGERIVDYVGGLRLPTPTWEVRHRLHQRATDADGRFRFGNLYPGLFAVTVTAPDDDALVAQVDAASGTTNLRVVLDPDAVVGVTFEGIARDALTLQPLPVFEVTPMVAGENGGMAGYSHRFEDPTGAYRLTGLEGGVILLMANAEDYATWTTEPLVYAPGVHTLDILFQPRRTAVFQVVDSHGQPITGAQLNFRDQEGRDLTVELSASTAGASLYADGHGIARASGLPAEWITVSVFRYDLRQTVDFPVDLRAAPLGPIELAMPDPGEVQVPVHVFTAGLLAPSPQVSTGLATFEDDLASGRIRSLGVPIEIVVTDASGLEVSRGRVEPGETTEPAIHLPAHGALGRWTSVPWKQEMSMTVHAPGYAPSELAGCIGCLDDSGVPALFVVLIPE